MNICEAIRKGREENRAIKRSSWVGSLYAYHGMDNQLLYSTNDNPVGFPIAVFLEDDWELADFPYHGKLDEQEQPDGLGKTAC